MGTRTRMKKNQRRKTRRKSWLITGRKKEKDKEL